MSFADSERVSEQAGEVVERGTSGRPDWRKRHDAWYVLFGFGLGKRPARLCPANHHDPQFGNSDCIGMPVFNRRSHFKRGIVYTGLGEFPAPS
jgi:hypothetical protein